MQDRTRQRQTEVMQGLPANNTESAPMLMPCGTQQQNSTQKSTTCPMVCAKNWRWNLKCQRQLGRSRVVWIISYIGYCYSSYWFEIICWWLAHDSEIWRISYTTDLKLELNFKSCVPLAWAVYSFKRNPSPDLHMIKILCCSLYCTDNTIESVLTCWAITPPGISTNCMFSLRKW